MIRSSVTFRVVLVLLIATQNAVLGEWHITAPSDDVEGNPEMIPCTGNGPTSSSAYLYQYKQGGSGWELYGYTKNGENPTSYIETDDIVGDWISTAFPGENNPNDPYSAGQYQLRIPDVPGTDPIVGFTVLGS